MGKLIVKETKLQDVKLITSAVFGDHRGFFTESYIVEVIQIVILKLLELILILFKIITLFLLKQVSYVVYIFNVVKLHKQS